MDKQSAAGRIFETKRIKPFIMTVAAIDRIIHHSNIIEIEGDSYRKNQSLQNKTIS
ncbi:MAG: hypothetical protein RLZ92_1525 [Pseudomonadota bacterium]|jgi:DNA replication protein DnaC